MKILKVSNKWLLDVNELILMGCSSKTSGNTIWKFWTWLKYAIAVLTRENIDFEIYIWSDKVIIQKDSVMIRDKEFEQIIINYHKTSITTNLWVEWEPWQWIREFIANAKDAWWWFELTYRDKLNLSEWETTIVFNYEQVEDYLSQFDFDDWEEVCDWYFFKKLENPRRAKVFKEWFLVYEAEDNSSFDYRIDSLKINESRMAEDRWEVKRWIAKIQSLMNKEEVEIIIENKETNLWIYYSNDSLSSWWDNISYTKDLGWMELKESLRNKEAENKWENEVKLYNRWNTFVHENNEVADWIFYQDEKDDYDELWDIDLNTNKIYIWQWEFNREWDDESEALMEACKIRDINDFCKEKWFKNAIDAVLYFKY